MQQRTFRPERGRSWIGATAVMLVLLANAAIIVWLWVHGGNLSHLKHDR